MFVLVRTVFKLMQIHRFNPHRYKILLQTFLTCRHWHTLRRWSKIKVSMGSGSLRLTSGRIAYTYILFLIIAHGLTEILITVIYNPSNG